MPNRVIEYPAVGSSYHYDEYGVYEYGEYEDWSVLAGQEKRTFLDRFATLEEARAAFPDASYAGDDASTGYREVNIPHDPPDWFDPMNAGETWDDD